MAKSEEEQGGRAAGDAARTTLASDGDPREATPAAVALEAAEAADAGNVTAGLDLVLDVPLRLTVEIGGTQLLVREVLQLDKGAVVELDRMSGEPADVLVNGRVVARGEVTVVEDRLAVRIVEVTGAEESARSKR